MRAARRPRRVLARLRQRRGARRRAAAAQPAAALPAQARAVSLSQRLVARRVREPGAQIALVRWAHIDHELLRAAAIDEALRARDVGLRARTDGKAAVG